MKLTAIVTAHKDTPWGIIKNLEAQTVKPKRILAAVSGWRGTEGGSPLNHSIEYVQDKNDYGYDKRNRLLKLVEDDCYIGFFNHDDSYELEYIEKMLAAAAKIDADVACCAWSQTIQGVPMVMGSSFVPGGATLGSFIIKSRTLLDAGGFQTDVNDELCMHVDHTVYQYKGLDADITATAKGWADSRLIWKLVRSGASVAEVKEVLYHRNVPYKRIARPMIWGVRQ